VLRGKAYELGDSVVNVVELDEPYEGHTWTWKVKITTFFIHEFYGKIGSSSRVNNYTIQHCHHHLL
jgi:hypothetical protein